jgi:hypothetical protein
MAREADQFGIELQRSRIDAEEVLLERQLEELEVARVRLGEQHMELRKQRLESRVSLRERKKTLERKREVLEVRFVVVVVVAAACFGRSSCLLLLTLKRMFSFAKFRGEEWTHWRELAHWRVLVVRLLCVEFFLLFLNGVGGRGG